MEKLIHLSLIQKNIRCLQNFRRLREDVLAYPLTTDELRRYLHEEEDFFFQEFCENREALKRERAELTRLKTGGIQFTFSGDNLYPPSFQGMPGAPIFLSYKGHPAWMWGRSLSVVG